MNDEEREAALKLRQSQCQHSCIKGMADVTPICVWCGIKANDIPDPPPAMNPFYYGMMGGPAPGSTPFIRNADISRLLAEVRAYQEPREGVLDRPPSVLAKYFAGKDTWWPLLGLSSR